MQTVYVYSLLILCSKEKKVHGLDVLPSVCHKMHGPGA
jgi:hypothetical protein